MGTPTIIAAGLARRHGARLVRRLALLAALGVIGLPLLLSLLVLALFAGSPEAQCQAAGAQGGVEVQASGPPAGLSERQRQLFAAPLQLQTGRWYPVGATNFYAGDGSGTASTGAIPDPAQADLTQHPDTFAELSLKTTNAGITFDTANALGRLPWMTGLRVAYHGKTVVLYKRDIGYGQGAQTIEGERYRIDLWGPAARALGVSSSLVQVQLAPRPGAGNTLGDTPNPTDASDAGAGCADLGATGGPLPLTPGQRAKLLPNGLAAAPADAPTAVKRMIAAGNQIVGRPYLLGGGHGLPLSQLSATYDCSSSVSHLLYGGGLVDVNYTPASGDMAAGYGRPGYGTWVSVLANADHVYAYVAGLRWDTHRYGAGDQGVAGIGWHTARRPDTGFTPRHPEGL